MKLTRIAKLRLRVFRDFAWPTELHPFAQFTLLGDEVVDARERVAIVGLALFCHFTSVPDPGRS